jgi:hypothetical protein
VKLKCEWWGVTGGSREVPERKYVTRDNNDDDDDDDDYNNNNNNNLGRNNITCNTNCKYRTAVTLYTL